ncbi:hypothetical protein BV924_10265 [Pectobacterium odoriferum]|uniref:Uncharacterized protein n=1 Tax=Pectobacterium odoriferum TaxID=78398 RepID=A0ABD6VS09_9GAMM|nr:hypothetical protein BV925_17435 [Pectobacterium odoriferum]POD96122.1 hypothetical protein BVY06_10440 [Pectobacterium odoriferum]POE13492.1 hypothetical protein BV924_10265 [Pectobacterium odoriferum]POE26690.1 hypothetical protein BV926_10265 [Pectobacterium odoriferum]POE31486.1 hypothetical protein BV919_10260 [Pectobacterium odoriferum]
MIKTITNYHLKITNSIVASRMRAAILFVLLSMKDAPHEIQKNNKMILKTKNKNLYFLQFLFTQ